MPQRPGQYGSQSRDRARALRGQQTDAEARLWFLLRNRHSMPFKFRRQHPLGPYILDFFCLEQKLAIELDGSQHLEQENAAKDDARTRYLESRGIRVLRFDNRQMLLESEAVLSVILETLKPSP